MNNTRKRIAALTTIVAFVVLAIASFSLKAPEVLAQTPTATPTPPSPLPSPTFDQAGALAKLREQIKGREQQPAGTVFKNVQMLKEMPAARLLAVMENGYARSLGVNCTHCHIPDKWESEENSDKEMAREMAAMVNRLNTELLKGIKNMPSTAVVNCTTCHRGQVKPATNLPTPPRS